MVLAWQDPPETVSGTIWTDKTVNLLRSKPGKWALIKIWPYTSPSRDSIAQPPPDIEYRFAYRRLSPTNHCQLYARTILEEQPLCQD